MKYLVMWHLTDPSSLRAAAERFLENGGTPPEGATLVGRWFGTNGKGCAVLEASDPKPVFELVSQCPNCGEHQTISRMSRTEDMKCQHCGGTADELAPLTAL